MLTSDAGPTDNARCLRSQPYSGTGAATIFDGEESVEASVEASADGPQVGAIAENGAGDNDLATIEPLESGESS